MHTGALASTLKDLAMRLDASAQAHADFIATGAAARNRDLYAAFEPFNEASRALYPLLPLLRSQLAPGDLIVDLWCRTGWTGALLAGLFPQQQVLSFWDRPSNVLGYAGFDHWLGTDQRAANWAIAFASPGERLPLPDGCAALVHGADCAHRFEPDALLGESLRVARGNGALVFPHVHLANREPQPYFERGGTLRAGQFYRDWFAQAPGIGERQAYVMSERRLFAEQAATVLHDEHAGDYCNALIAVLATALDGTPLAAAALPGEAALLVNPLVCIDAISGLATYDPATLAGHGEHLLDRHPVYRARLSDALPLPLSSIERSLVFLAQQGHAPQAIRQQLACSQADYQAALQRLCQHEILQAAPVGMAMARLHRYYVTRQDAALPADHHFRTLWSRCAARYGAKPLLVSDDESVFGFDDLDTLVAAVAALLQAQGARTGDRIALLSSASVEALLVAWAAWSLGLVLVPLNPAMDAALCSSLLMSAAPRLLFCEPAYRALAPPGLPVFELGAESAAAPDTDRPTLAASLQPHLGAPLPPAPAGLAALEAVVLFTSGSSGRPKGVVLTQGALFRSAHALCEALDWGDSDVLWSLGGPHSMSGLRNPAWAALAGGLTVFVPSGPHHGHPAVVADTCRRWGITVISTVPAFLTQLRELARAGSPPQFGALREIAVTGAPLGLGLQSAVEQAFGLGVRFYYGLTETAGICFAVPRGQVRCADGDIGVACGAIARLVDDQGHAVAEGAVGHLQLFSGNLTSGYLQNPAASARLFAGGWLHTGDLAHQSGGHTILLGRCDHQIKDASGDIVQLEALESLLEAHAGVTEAAVIAQGEGDVRALLAFVALDEHCDASPVESLQQLLARTVASSRLAVQVTVLKKIPRLPDGKIARRQLTSLVTA